MAGMGNDVQYKRCETCEGEGFLMEVIPRFVEGEDSGNGDMFMRFSVGTDRAVKVPCTRCEGLKVVPVRVRKKRRGKQ
jgi:hypothetical protein